MKPVLIAVTDSQEAEKISETLPQDQKAAIIESSNRLGRLVKEAALVIVDDVFYERYGLEFFKELFKNPHPPFLMLAPPDDRRIMMEIMELGMRYIPKVSDYQKLLRLAVSDTLALIHEQEHLQLKVAALQMRVNELENTEQNETTLAAAEAAPELQPHEADAKILNEIIFVFKRGAIELPTLPQMSIKFQEMMNKGANLQDIGDFLKQDVAISSKLISVSNSAYYRGVSESKNLGQAISRLGLKTTKQYVDTICNRSLYATKNKKFLKYLENLWEHSLACAYASQILAESLALGLENDAFTLGLLHDIGKLLLLQVIGELQMKQKIGDEVEASELLHTVRVHHAKFGAALLKKWKFHEDFAKIAAYHNTLEASKSISKDLLVVHLANLMVKSMGYALNGQEDAPEAAINLEETESARHLGLDASMIDEFKNKVSDFMQEFGGLLA